MTNRKAVMISLIALFLAAICGWQLAIFSAHASARSVGPPSQDSPSPTLPADPTFEYKILIFPSMEAYRKLLEDEINKLAEQGYVVERFQRESPLSARGYEGGSFYLNSSSEITVLLKRQKK